MNVNQLALLQALEFYKSDILLDIYLLAPVDTGALRGGLGIDFVVSPDTTVTLESYSDVSYFEPAMVRESYRLGYGITGQVLRDWTPKIVALAEQIKHNQIVKLTSEVKSGIHNQIGEVLEHGISKLR